MKKVLVVVIAIALIAGLVVACDNLGVKWFSSMQVLGAQAGNATVEGNIMAVFYFRADEQALFWVTNAQIIDNGDGTWDITSPQRIVGGVSQALVEYGLYQYKELPLEIPPGTYLDDLDLQNITWQDLPHSEHIGVLKAVNPSLARPATVTRRYMGVNYDVPCLVSEAVKDAYQAGDIEIGDYVIVSFIDEIPNQTERHIAVVVDKIYESW